jgi:uncharacterized protein (TIGR02301 family)
MVRIVSGFLLAAAVVLAAAQVQAQDFWRTLIAPPRFVRPAPPPQNTVPAAVNPANPAAKQSAPAPAPEVPPAYEKEMARLAEILGALHYLRPLCGTADGNRWRNEMSSLIEAEQPPAERRDRMVASFNRSYGAYEQTYRSCTPAAELAISRFIDEGAKLSREIATRYGN